LVDNEMTRSSMEQNSKSASPTTGGLTVLSHFESEVFRESRT
jgi:hypothetical protein